MGCTGCYNNCTEIISDKCVRYTGNDISFLQIETDMPLSEVEEKITDFLQTVVDGSGIIPTLPESICDLVNDFLPSSGDITLNHVVSALVSSACSLQEQITSLSSDVEDIEADYTIGSCLSGVTSSSGTHDVLQAVINKLCTNTSTITVLQNSLTSYVKVADVNTYIANYINDSVSTKKYNKMIPYVAVEYYGDLAGKFDSTGAGIDDWEQIYLCNGLNGTPDKRGRFAVGTNSMGSNSYSSSSTDPTVAGNPNYNLLDTAGTNRVTLTTSNLPAHKHSTTVTLKDPGHKHLFGADNEIYVRGGYDPSGYTFDYDATSGGGAGKHLYTKDVNNTNNPQTTGITVDSVDVNNTGENISHENRPPVLACYYIMHIPD